MNQLIVRLKAGPDAHFLIGRTLACLILLVWCSTMFAQNLGGTKDQAKVFRVRATHVIGLERTPNNANGILSIEGNALEFQMTGAPAAQVSISSLRDVFLGEEDKQVGGTPMAVGRAATPFGGGRVIGLFSHKKYDTLTLEYLDTNGGFHGAIFQLNKGQGQVLRNELVANGAHFTQGENQPAKQNSEIKSETK